MFSARYVVLRSEGMPVSEMESAHLVAGAVLRHFRNRSIAFVDRQVELTIGAERNVWVDVRHIIHDETVREPAPIDETFLRLVKG